MRVLGLTTVLLCSALFGLAQQAPSNAAASEDDIQRLFVAMHARERTQLLLIESRKQSRAFLNDFLVRQVPQATKKPERVQSMIDEMIKGVFDNYPVDAALQDMVPIYRKHLTSSDVKSLVAFYSSPIGQKMLRELPAITTESMQVVNARLQPRLEAAASKLSESLENILEEHTPGESQ